MGNARTGEATPSKTESTRKPTPKQVLIAELTAASSGKTVSKNTINGLATFLLNADDRIRPELLGMLSQPDPYGNLYAVLPYLLRESLARHEERDAQDLACWVKAANNSFHAVDAVVITMRGKQRVTGTDYLTSRFIQGARHYTEDYADYTPTQLKDLTLVAAAAACATLKVDRPLPGFVNIGAGSKCYSIDGHDTLWCSHLTSKTIIDLVVSDHKTAQKILHLIMDQGAYTEEQILYYLDGGASSLVGGVI